MEDRCRLLFPAAVPSQGCSPQVSTAPPEPRGPEVWKTDPRYAGWESLSTQSRRQAPWLSRQRTCQTNWYHAILFPTWKTGIIAHTLISLPCTTTARIQLFHAEKAPCKLRVLCKHGRAIKDSGAEDLWDGTDHKPFLSGVEARKDPSSWIFFDLYLNLNENLRHRWHSN